MDVSATNSATQLLSQIQNTQKKEKVGADDFAAKILEVSDTNNDSAIDISEISLDAQAFSSFDSNSDGSLNSDELEDGITSKLQELKYNTSSSEDFASFLTDLGLEVPTAPQNSQMPNVSKIASDIFSSNNTDENEELSISELGISSELFTSIDSDESGSISKDELEEKLTSMFDGLQSGETSSSEFKETMDALGATPQSSGTTDTSSAENTGAGGSGGGAGGGGGGEAEEEYDAADTNEDGSVSISEYMEYYGTDESDTSSADNEQYTMDLVSTLVNAIKEETDEGNLDLSQFKEMMKMVNNETQDSKISSELNKYITNL